MTATFWLGYCLGLLTILAVSVALHVWSERKKRRTFEQEIAAIDAKYPPEASQAPTSVAAPDIARLQELLRIEASEGLTTGQAVEFNQVLQRLQKVPIALAPTAPTNLRRDPGRKDVH